MARLDPQLQKQHDDEIRSRLKVLKSKGLYGGDLRRRLTRYARTKANSPKFADVIAGKARVITAPTSKAAREYSGTFATFKKKIIVPDTAAPGKVKYNKTKKALTSDGNIIPKLTSHAKSGYEIHVHIKGGKSVVIYTASSLGEVNAFIGGYKQKWKGQYSVTYNGVLVDL